MSGTALSCFLLFSLRAFAFIHCRRCVQAKVSLLSLNVAENLNEKTHANATQKETQVVVGRSVEERENFISYEFICGSLVVAKYSSLFLDTISFFQKNEEKLSLFVL
jgi:hypothetical protein